MPLSPLPKVFTSGLWKSEEARKYVLSPWPTPTVYIPRWRKYKMQGSRCCVMECRNSAVSSVSTTTEVMQVFARAGLTCINDMEPTPLCKQHYQLVYDALQPRQCTTCGTRLRAGMAVSLDRCLQIPLIFPCFP